MAVTFVDSDVIFIDSETTWFSSDTMNTFPTLDSGQKIEGFIQEYGDTSVTVTDPQFGASFPVEKGTFFPSHFSFVLRHVSDTDKNTIETFYQDNKDLAFYWLNEQDSETYEVVFAEKPYCELDGQKNEWKLGIRLIQAF